MVALIDMTGKMFGRWTVIRRAPSRRRLAMWEAVCNCGTRAEVSGADLRFGASKSCGCLSRELLLAAAVTHGLSKSPEYSSWQAAKQRCSNPKHIEYPHYGARGIKMCERWRFSFPAFLEDMGKKPSPSHSIDRINRDGDYEPDNCRWATNHDQANNKRTTRFVEYRGQRMSVTEAIRLSETFISRRTVLRRLNRGWPLEEALTLAIGEEFCAGQLMEAAERELEPA